jgi:hypothetical protein
MKQILMIGAGHHSPKGPINFLHWMQGQSPVHAKGLFFRPVDYAALDHAALDHAFPATVPRGAGTIPVMELEDNEKEVIAVHKAEFSRQCEQYHIAYSLHDNDREWNKDLLQKESRFADLILISGAFFYAETDNNGRYLREVLYSAECPVLIVPENFTTLQRLFMAYDGSRDSLYALKQFCYLFPDSTELPTEILYVNEGAGDIIPDLDRLKQFTRAKFDCISFSMLRFNANDYLATWISEKKNALLVSGSFGRSSVSYLGNRSFSEDVVHDCQLPVFIAHR